MSDDLTHLDSYVPVSRIGSAEDEERLVNVDTANGIIRNVQSQDDNEHVNKFSNGKIEEVLN